MFPDILIGAVLMISGLLIIVYRQKLLPLMHRAIERMYGGTTAEMWASGRRVSVGMIIAGAGWIAMGGIAVLDALVV